MAKHLTLAGRTSAAEREDEVAQGAGRIRPGDAGRGYKARRRSWPARWEDRDPQ